MQTLPAAWCPTVAATHTPLWRPSGVDKDTIIKIVGHTSYKFTKRIYIHEKLPQLQAETNKIDRLVKQEITNNKEREGDVNGCCSGKTGNRRELRELNFRGEFEVCEIVERSIPVIQRQLEQNGEQISHLVYDVRIIGNIDQSLGLLERICVTVPGIKIIVVTEGLSTDSAFMRDILTLVPAEQIVSDHARS